MAGFSEAVRRGRAGMGERAERLGAEESMAADRLKSEIPELEVLSGAAPHILSVSLPGFRSEVLMNFLEAREVYVSKSSACKRGGRSYVLENCRLAPRVIDGALRIGLSRYSTEEDIDALCSGLRDAHRTLAHR